MKTENKINTNVNIFDLFLVAFISLKLAEEIDWSWWLVLIPLWIQVLLGLVGAAISSKKQ